MITETKFSLGDKVFLISLYSKQEYINCPVCNGKGGIFVHEHEFECKTCYGQGGRHVNLNESWQISYEKAKIGKIDIELYHKSYKKENKIRYMVDKTGVGSGTLWGEEDLFLTKEEALEECTKRNAKINQS